MYGGFIIMRFMVLFIALLVLLGIVFAGNVSCKSDKADKNADKADKNADKADKNQGLASLESWLNQPNNYFPWYSSGGSSFYSQGYSENTFSAFREYYTTSGTPVVGGIISTPIKFDIAQKTPTTIYYGVGQALPYSQYVSTVPSKTNDLWVQGETSWSQYVVSPVGTWLQLIANAPVGGLAGFYEMVQTDTTNHKYSTYQFNQGYNTMNFKADQVGRHMLYFVVNNQPSNVVIVDVFAQAPPAQYTPSGYGQTNSPSTQYQTYAKTTTTPIAFMPPQTPTVNGDTPVTIQSQGMRGYQVFLDGNYIGTEGTGGDPLDGRFSFNVVGNQNHDVRVYDGQFNYPKTMYFARGVQR
jgi:hypothetical protein